MSDVVRPERSSLCDEVTGAEIVKLTSEGENAHLYHYEDSFTPDDRWIVYNSSRNGSCAWWKMSTDDWTSVRTAGLRSAETTGTYCSPVTTERGMRICIS